MSLYTKNKIKKSKKISLSKVGVKKAISPYILPPKETPFGTLRKASFTIEAAVVLPLLSGFFVSVLFFFHGKKQIENDDLEHKNTIKRPEKQVF